MEGDVMLPREFELKGKEVEDPQRKLGELSGEFLLVSALFHDSPPARGQYNRVVNISYVVVICVWGGIGEEGAIATHLSLSLVQRCRSAKTRTIM